MGAPSARIEKRIAALEARIDQLDRYPFDRAEIGDREFVISEARVEIDKQLNDLYEQRDALAGGGKGFSLARFQEPGV